MYHSKPDFHMFTTILGVFIKVAFTGDRWMAVWILGGQL